MNSSLRGLFIGGTSILSCAAGFASAQPAVAPPPPPASTVAPTPAGVALFYDPQQLPAIKGTVSRYTLTPRGDVDGLILADGTEVRFPPHLSTQLVYTVKPGDTVTVRGLKALSIPFVAAASITNDASGQTVVDNGPGPGPGPKGAREAGQPVSVQGRVQITLHGPRGEVNGAMLEDGTILRLPPPEAQRFAALLTPGQNVSIQGYGLSTSLGRVIEVRAIGQAGMQLNYAQEPGGPGKKGGKGRRPPDFAFVTPPPAPSFGVAPPPPAGPGAAPTPPTPPIVTPPPVPQPPRP